MVLTDDIINATQAANTTFAGIPYKANSTLGTNVGEDALAEHDR